MKNVFISIIDFLAGINFIAGIPWFTLGVLFSVFVYIWLKRKRFKPAKLNISLGGVGYVELTPNKADLQIAHQIWTELMTRKAAIPIDPDNDIIHMVHDSWYQLFGRVRELIAEVPADMIYDNKSTKQIVDIAFKTLNDGLRPHLTKWQARYKNWYDVEQKKNPGLAPQDVQKKYPEYINLVQDMLSVNVQLRQYADELEKMVNSKRL